MYSSKLLLLFLSTLVALLNPACAERKCCPSSGCTSLLNRIENEFYEASDTMRRNVPSTLISDYMKYRVTTLTEWIKMNCDCGTHKLQHVCLTDEEYNEYANSLPSVVSVPELINQMTHLDLKPFFLKPNANANQMNYPDSLIYPFDKNQEKRLTSNWRSTSKVGAETSYSNASEVEQFVSVPSGVDMSYEPLTEPVRCKEFNKYAINSHLIDSPQFMREVIAFVGRMYLCGVKYEDYMQILRHATAYAYSGVRCRRVEKSSLQVSRAFYAWYREIARGFIDKSCPVGEITTQMVETHLSWVVRDLTSHHCWGRIKCLRFSQGRVVLENVGEEMLTNKFLDPVRQELGLTPGYVFTPSNVIKISPDSQELMMRTSKTDHRKISLNDTRIEGFILPAMERTTSCGTGFYLGPDGTTCCGLVCQCASLLASVGTLTEADCCALCNDQQCGASVILADGSTYELADYEGGYIEFPLRVMI